MPRRNIGIIAHIDAGKTTLSERMLFYTESIHRMGEVHEGAATMDFLPEEQDRGITIASACTTCTWGDTTINLIDTPGHVDFTMEVERALRVLDGAVGVFCAVAGVEPQSETVWRQSEKFAVPKLVFINKMDRPGASFASVLAALADRLHVRPVPVVIPLGAEENFAGVLDLLSREKLFFDQADQGRTVTRSPFGPEEEALAAPWLDTLLEAAADEDDLIMEAVLSGESVPPEALRATVRKATLARRIVPVFAGSALRNIGVQPLLDGIRDFLPAPEDVAAPLAILPAKGNPVGQEQETIAVPCTPEAPLCALVFKVIMEGGRSLSLLRLYAGTLREGMALVNVSRGKLEKCGRVFRLLAHQREHIASALAGDIVAVQGLRSARTGDSITSPEHPLLLENIDAYTPVISLALEVKNTEEGKKLDDALERALLEDPTLRLELDDVSGQRLLSGMGELHLEVLLDRLRREYGVSPRVGNPRVVHRESIRGEAEGTGEFDRELGDQRHYGFVSVQVAPRERGEGNRIFFSDLGEGWQPLLMEAVRQGLDDALNCGPLGYVVEDVAVTLLRLERKEGLATAPGFRMAAAMALKQAFQAAGGILLEPVMDVDISVPEPQVGAVVSLLGSRGGKVEEIRDEGGQTLIRAGAPMRGLFGFATALRSATQGRAGFQLRFARFDRS